MENKNLPKWNWKTPELVCSKIINNCDHETILALRLVSFHWNHSIEKIGALCIVYNESYPENIAFLQRISPQIYHVCVRCINTWESAYKTLGISLNDLKILCKLTNYFPNYLQKLSQLTSLTLEGNSLFLNNFVPSEIEVDIGSNYIILQHLKFLTLRVNYTTSMDFIGPSGLGLQMNVTENITYILKYLKTQHLISLEIVDYVTKDSRNHREQNNLPFWEDEILINFISTHSNKLKKLLLICSGSKDSTKDIGQSSSLRSIPMFLTDVTIRFRENEGCFMNTSYNFQSNESKYWIRLLMNQSHLKNLDLCSFADFSNGIFRSIVDNNFLSLENINCCGLSLLLELGPIEGPQIFTDSYLQKCEYLVKLKLGLGCLYTSFDTLLQKIPKNLEELEIMCTRVPIIELQNVIQLHKLKSLKLIGVAFNTRTYSYCSDDVNTKQNELRLEVLKNILNMRNLNEFFLCGFQDLRTSFYSEKFIEFVQALSPVSSFGEEYEFAELYKILGIRVRIRVVVKIEN